MKVFGPFLWPAFALLWLTIALAMPLGGLGAAPDEDTIVNKSDGKARYTNVRYAYAVSYSPAIFTAEPESDSGDGKKLLAKDGQATISLYGHAALNTEGAGEVLSFSQLYSNSLRQASRDAKISYKKEGKGWFVISGTKGKQIFYQKSLYDAGIEKVFWAEYAQSAKTKYDPIIASSAGSFRNVLGGWVGSKTMGSQSKYPKP
jgi:hypothetical protein